MKKFIFAASFAFSVAMISCDNDSAPVISESDLAPPVSSTRLSIDEALENAERMFAMLLFGLF